jgi:hypothetical protein
LELGSITKERMAINPRFPGSPGVCSQKVQRVSGVPRRLEKVGEGSRKLENFEKVGEHLGESTNKYANEVRKMEQIDGS